MIGIYFYSVSYGTMEGGEDTTLWSEDYYTQDVWKQMIFDSVTKAIRENNDRYIHDYESLHSEVVEIMIRDYDVHKIPIQESISFFGWGSLFDKDDWNTNRGKELNELTDHLLKQGFTAESDSSYKYRKGSEE